MSSEDTTSKVDEMYGRVLLGRYRVVRPIALGRTGEVYLARAEEAAGAARPVAIKRIVPGLHIEPACIERFVQQAQILSRLRDPGIVDVLEIAEERGAYLVALEYMHGYDLGQWQRYLLHRGKRIPSDIAIQILVNVLDALHRVHIRKSPGGINLQIIHRNISPSNIMLSVEGRAKLTDFALDRTAGKIPGAGRVDDVPQGALSYTAPEILSGREGSVQSDIFSCGVVLHELLFGNNVFRAADSAEIIRLLRELEPDSIHGVRDDAPDDIDEIIGKALAKLPVDRYLTARQFAFALRTAQTFGEQDTTGKLAARFGEDFGKEMAGFLGVDTLQQRDLAWRTRPLPRAVRRHGEKPGLKRVRPVAASGRIDAPAAEIELDIPIVEDIPNETAASTDGLADQTAGASFSRLGEAPVAGAYALLRKPRIWYVIAAILGVAGVVVAILTNSGPQPESKSQGQQFVMVQKPVQEIAGGEQEKPATGAQGATDQKAVDEAKQEAGEEAENETKEESAAEEQPSTVGESATTPAESAEVARPAIVKKPGVTKDRTTNLRAVTRAFRRREATVQNCFRRHAVELKGKPKINILFLVNRSGRVEDAKVSPEGIANTALGKCIHNVAASTRFPRQAEQISFRIPVTAQRVKSR